MPLLILPERSLLLIYSMYYLPIFIVLGVSQCYKTAAKRNQAASRAGSMRANRTEQTLGILSAAVKLDYWTSYREADVEG